MKDLLLDLNVCPCCSPALIGILATVMLVFILVTGFVLQLFTKKGSKVQRLLIGCTHGIVLLIAIFFGGLSVSPDMRSRVFSKMLLSMKSPAMDPLRCDLLGKLQGRVLELGPGGGANFKCWGNNSDTSSITEWVGVEPNTYFKDALSAVQVANGITFPTSVVWMNGEDDIDVEPGSFDAVIATHVLCSVDDVPQVLSQIHRALKTGGTYHFMEHVATQEAEFSLMWTTQKLLEPFLALVGNGCGIRPLWEQLDALSQGDANFDVTLEHFAAPMPLYPLVPHIKGTATKTK